jgi:hypothetical protein
MKINIAVRWRIPCAVALALTSTAASAAQPASIQACMESFADQHFPGRVVSFQVTENRLPMQPLIASTGTQSVEIVATDGQTGRLIATAFCKVKQLGRAGSVIVGTVDSDG